MTEKVRVFPCKSCGAKLSFSPGSKTLKCPYCAATNDIPDTDDTVEELSLEAWLAKLEGESETHQQEQIKCNSCGGEQTLAANLYASACTFCGTPLTSKSYAQRLIKPKSSWIGDNRYWSHCWWSDLCGIDDNRSWIRIGGRCRCNRRVVLVLKGKPRQATANRHRRDSQG